MTTTLEKTDPVSPPSPKTSVRSKLREQENDLHTLLSQVISSIREQIAAQTSEASSNNANNEIPGMLTDLETAADQLRPIIASLRPRAGKKYIPQKKHDACGKLTPILTILNELIDEPPIGTSKSDKLRLNLSQQIATSIAKLLGQISIIARDRKRSWRDIDLNEDETMEEGKALLDSEKIRGKTIFIIDDDTVIAKRAAKAIQKAGGTVITHTGEGSLPDSEVNIVLLDHHLKNSLRGHMLLGTIREKYPSAQIVVHSSNSKDHEAMTPYGKTPKMDKLNWNELNTILAAMPANS